MDDLVIVVAEAVLIPADNILPAFLEHLAAVGDRSQVRLLERGEIRTFEPDIMHRGISLDLVEHLLAGGREVRPGTGFGAGQL